MIEVSDKFHSRAFGQVINPIVKLYISFEKELKLGSFFTLNQSTLDGADIIKASSIDVPAQNWDFYNYKDFSDRVVSIDWERSLEFPYQIQCGMVDFSLDNTDGYFTPLNPSSSIGKNNLPSRPFRAYAGFGDNNEIIPQIVGLTQGMPEMSSDSYTTGYHGVDFLYDICSKSLRNAIDMKNVTTDQVIEAILQDYGLAPSQYKLAKGHFKIPFVFYDIGEDAGTALKQLVQSENGYMWLDEKGLVRFETISSINSQVGTSAKLTDYDIISIEAASADEIINHVRITAEVREVQEWQEVYTKSSSSSDVSNNLWVVRPNESIDMTCSLSDPCYDIVAPVLNRASAVSWFTAITSAGNPVTSGITATGELTSNSYKVTFTNSNSYPIEIDEMVLWGEPAKVYDVLDYDAYDDESVEKYGDSLLEIVDNKFFQSYYQADLYGKTMISRRKDYARELNVSVKGDFSFQLMDMLEIETSAGNYDGVYRITRMYYSWNGSELITEMTLSDGHIVTPGLFTLNVSQINGEDLIQ